MTDAGGRNAALRQMLTGRWRHIQEDADVSRSLAGAETLMLIDEALFLLDAGEYGYCVDCDGEIAEADLRALPFAMRCRACDDAGPQLSASVVGRSLPDAEPPSN